MVDNIIGGKNSTSGQATVDNIIGGKNSTSGQTTVDNIIGHMRISCCVPKATNTNSDYVIITAFPLQQWLHERASVLLYTYIVIQNDCQGFNNLPPRSPHATPCDFILWSYVKDQVYVPPLPASIPELMIRIRTAIETITADMLQTVWNELDYRVDICRNTKGAHTGQL